jgi:hypothetical protein
VVIVSQGIHEQILLVVEKVRDIWIAERECLSLPLATTLHHNHSLTLFHVSKELQEFF